MSVPSLIGTTHRRQAATRIRKRTTIVCISVVIVEVLALTNNFIFQRKASILNAKIRGSLSLEEPSSLSSSSLSSPFSHQAYEESYGLFNEMTDAGWEQLKERVRRQRQVEDRTPHTDDKNYCASAEWYGLHFEPEFTCQHEERVGGKDGDGNGDGPKWICNPRRLKEVIKERFKNEGKGCLIYSIGSKGMFDFEEAMASLMEVDDDNDGVELPKNLCEIHTFDMDDFSDKVPAKFKDKGTIVFHPWGLKGQTEIIQDNPEDKVYHSLQEIIQLLGHENRVIDIFKIDCEGCEWTTYNEWLSAPVDIRQIQVEVHKLPKNGMDFFGDIQDAGYVIFHKEPNVISMKDKGTAIEYAFLKLKKSFFAFEEKSVN